MRRFNQTSAILIVLLREFCCKFTGKHQMFSHESGHESFCFTDYTVLEQLIQDKFSVIITFREEAKQRDLPLTMVWAYHTVMKAIMRALKPKVALSNLNLAEEVRSGDQVVVKKMMKRRINLW